MRIIILISGFLCLLLSKFVLLEDSKKPDDSPQDSTSGTCYIASGLSGARIEIVKQTAQRLLSAGRKSELTEIFKRNQLSELLDGPRVTNCELAVRISRTKSDMLQNVSDYRVTISDLDKQNPSENKTTTILDHKYFELESGHSLSQSYFTNEFIPKKCATTSVGIYALFNKFRNLVFDQEFKETLKRFKMASSEVNRLIDSMVLVATELQLLLILCEDVGSRTRLFDLSKFGNQLGNILNQAVCRAKEDFLDSQMADTIRDFVKSNSTDPVTVLSWLERDYPYWSWEIQKHHGAQVSQDDKRSLMCGAFVSEEYKEYLITYNDKEYDCNDNSDKYMNFNQKSHQLAYRIVKNSFEKMPIPLALINNQLNYSCLDTNHGLRCKSFLGHFREDQSQTIKDHVCYSVPQNYFPTLCPPNFHTTKSSITLGVESYWCGLSLGLTVKNKGIRSCGPSEVDIRLPQFSREADKTPQRFWKNRDINDTYVENSDVWMLVNNEFQVVRKFESFSSDGKILLDPDADLYLNLTGDRAYWGVEKDKITEFFGLGSWNDFSSFNFASSFGRERPDDSENGCCEVDEAEWTASYSFRRRKFVKKSNAPEWYESRNEQYSGGRFNLTKIVSDRHVILTRDNKTVTLNHSFFDDSANYSDWSFKLGYWSKWSLKFYNESSAQVKSSDDPCAGNSRPLIRCKRVKRFEWHDTSNTTKYVRSLQTKTWMRITKDKGITNEYYEYEADWESETFTLFDAKEEMYLKLSRKVARIGKSLESLRKIESGTWNNVDKFEAY